MALGQEVGYSFPADQVGPAGFFIRDPLDEDDAAATLDSSNFNSVSTGPAITCTNADTQLSKCGDTVETNEYTEVRSLSMQ